MTTELARTPLHDWHVAHGGRMVDFAGWSMPVQYTSIVSEHQATRKQTGLFDISHMGRLRFDGAGADAFLDRLVTRRVTDMSPGRIRYGLVVSELGGVLDDVLTYRLQDANGGDYYCLVVNAGNREKILNWLAPRLADARDVTMTDMTHAWAMIAVQGPLALERARPLLDVEPGQLKYYTGVESQIAGHTGIVSRTGYTGEDGVELMLEANQAATVWERLIAAGATACGLGCRDTLRLEAAMPLYGHELTEAIDPYTADLAFAVDLDGRDFTGREALAKLNERPAPRTRIGLTLSGKRVPREHFAVQKDGAIVGEISSGTFSPTLDMPIAMAYVDRAHAALNNELTVDIRGRGETARVVKLPFYRRQK
jgi:aminomethyltransferase